MRPYFLFALFAGHPFSPLFSRHLFTPFSPLESALFCRAKGTAQSLERGTFRMDLSPKFGKETPSRNLRKRRSGKEKTHKHKHKQICGIVPGLGVCQNFVYVFFFGGHSLWGRKNHINKVPPQNPGTTP